MFIITKVTLIFPITLLQLRILAILEIHASIICHTKIQCYNYQVLLPLHHENNWDNILILLKQCVARTWKILDFLWKATSITVLKTSRNALAQNASFVISLWKEKESTLVIMHIICAALFALVAGEVFFLMFFYYLYLKNNLYLGPLKFKAK